MLDQKEPCIRQDVACVRCRERKVRCGRERPSCMNCKSEKSECEYNQPEKRVNHTKLLCRNFDRLEDRLGSIETELSWLTAILKTGTFQQGVASATNGDSIVTNNTGEIMQRNAVTQISTPSRRIVRGADGVGDQYHGPATLLSLCYDLKESFLSETKRIQSTEETKASPPKAVLPDSTSIGSPHEIHSVIIDGGAGSASLAEVSLELLERLCFVASFETQLDTPEHTSIRLPPKQLLLMVMPQFFSKVDYSTDIFVESQLTANMERIYSRAPAPDNDAWAICFNTIILLVLGSDNSTRSDEPLMESQFSLPFFNAMRAALHQARFLTTPKLINVQALALLSLAAQRYYPCARGGAIFGQACLLARLAGLHQTLAAPTDIAENETKERFKTFMSLYLRDKSLSLSWYSICWLSSFDCTLSLQLRPSTFADPQITSRIRLAETQELLYRCISVDGFQSSSQMNNDIASITRSLENWAHNYGASLLTVSSANETELQLTFLATRMLAYSRRHDDGHRKVLLDDARASCAILLVSYGKQDRNILAVFDSHTNLPTSSAKHNMAQEEAPEGGANSKPSEGRLTSLLDAFPVMAFFLLAKNILWSFSPEVNEVACTDLQILQDVYSCFVEVNSGIQSENRAWQIERTFELVLKLIEHTRNRGLNLRQSSSHVTEECHGWTPNSTNLGLSYGNLPTPPTPTSADMSWSFVNMEFGDGMTNFGEQMEPQMRGRKRARTVDVDFSVNDGALGPVMSTDWSTGLELDR